MMDPLSVVERDRLLRFMDRPGGPSFAEGIGVLHAVVSAPRRIPPSEWLVDLIGDRELDEADDAQLFVRLYDEAVRSFEERELRLLPSLEDEGSVQRLCAGYVRIAMADRAWRANDEATVACFPLLCLAKGKRPSELGDFPAIHDGDRWLREQRAALPETMLAVHELLEEQRRPALRPRTLRRSSAKIGRNDPCPCGSGRKYKKCCLPQA